MAVLGAVPAHGIFQICLVEVAVLVVSERLLDGDLDHVEYVRALLEDAVHLLQRTVASFWEEEVDDREDEGVDDGEDDL